MGMNGYILAVGPYSDAVKDCLDYPSNWYNNVTAGRMVKSTLFRQETTMGTNDLLFCLGIDNDPAEWYLANEYVSLRIGTIIKDMKFTNGHEAQRYSGDDMKSFVVLVENGFDFIFDPGA